MNFSLFLVFKFLVANMMDFFSLVTFYQGTNTVVGLTKMDDEGWLCGMRDLVFVLISFNFEKDRSA